MTVVDAFEHVVQYPKLKIVQLTKQLRCNVQETILY